MLIFVNLGDCVGKILCEFRIRGSNNDINQTTDTILFRFYFIFQIHDGVNILAVVANFFGRSIFGDQAHFFGYHFLQKVALDDGRFSFYIACRKKRLIIKS